MKLKSRKSSGATVRSRAAKALAAAWDKDAACAPPESPGDPSPEIGHELPRSTRVAFDTDAGALGIRFDPALAPLASTRFVALARSGFYTGVVVHRVVPGFVVQLGDRGADGYGGSGDALRCETSPVPFAPLDVGVALAVSIERVGPPVFEALGGLEPLPPGCLGDADVDARSDHPARDQVE